MFQIKFSPLFLYYTFWTTICLNMMVCSWGTLVRQLPTSLIKHTLRSCWGLILKTSEMAWVFYGLVCLLLYYFITQYYGARNKYRLESQIIFCCQKEVVPCKHGSHESLGSSRVIASPDRLILLKTQELFLCYVPLDQLWMQISVEQEFIHSLIQQIFLGSTHWGCSSKQRETPAFMV